MCRAGSLDVTVPLLCIVITPMPVRVWCDANKCKQILCKLV
jgi:hypothetical protein